LLLHDSARPHTANETNETLQNFKWEVLEHPPYSPDLLLYYSSLRSKSFFKLVCMKI
jgi:transposase